MIVYKVIVLSVFVFAILFLGQAPEPENDSTKMIEELKRLVSTQSQQVNINIDNRVKEIKKKIADQGEEAIPFLESEIDKEKDGAIRRELVLTLAKIPGERVDRKLLHLFCFDTQVMSAAGSELIWRTEHNGPFTFRVPEEEIQEMIRRIRVEHVFVIGDFMRVLAMCAQNPEEPRLRPMLDRFIADIKNTSATDRVTAVGGSYVSPRVFILNKFLLAFRHMGTIARHYLKEALRLAQEEKDTEVEKWLSMALGITGDREVATFLKDMVQSDPDRYIRGQAIIAYAESAGQDAIPLLKELFLHDKTESEYLPEDSPGRFFISVLARGELARLTEEEFRNTPYMQKIDTLLVNNSLSREKVKEIGGKTIMALYDRKDTMKTFQKARDISKAFHDQDMAYILDYISKRRSVDPNDPFALVLEFDISLSYRKYAECLNYIEAIVTMVSRQNMPCDKYNIVCIHSMIARFESTYREDFLDPDGQKDKKLALAMTSLALGYLFESEGCL